MKTVNTLAAWRLKMLVLCRKLLYRRNIRFLPFLITSASYEVIFELVAFHTLSEQLVQNASSNRYLRRLTASQLDSQCIKNAVSQRKIHIFSKYFFHSSLISYTAFDKNKSSLALLVSSTDLAEIMSS